MEKTKIVGGSFVLDHIEKDHIITPEDMTEEQRMIVEMTRDFGHNEIAPKEETLEELDYELTLQLLREAADLGLLGVNIPEQFGGLGLDKVSATYITEMIARNSSFSISMGTQTGIGSLPIVFFGTPEQKAKYLPDIAAATRIGAYCLTEPSSGTDALSAKTIAVLSEDGRHYILNGSKVFITNGGFADIFIVYAKVNGQQFSAFIVEKGMEGFTIGPEEKKMGIKASSTRSLFFENVPVPVENLLGEIGKGHLIAFNILNIGRHTLAAGSVGSSKETLELSVKYANERTQFEKAIIEFPLTAKKIAEMNILIYALETMVYRTAGLFDEIMKDIDHSSVHAGKQSAQVIAEYAIECSINKVFGSEVLDRIADEGVQIHGGYGYTREYKVERIYRDSRINRIFEGTNEINRLLITGTLLKKALKGELPLMEKIRSIEAELSQFEPRQAFEEILGKEFYLESVAKKIFFMVGGLAVQKYGAKLENEQEVVAELADILIQIFAVDGVLLRTSKLMAKKDAENAIQMAQVFVQEAFHKIQASAKEILTTIESGEALQNHLKMLDKLSEHTPINVTVLKREIAMRVAQAEKYIV